MEALITLSITTGPPQDTQRLWQRTPREGGSAETVPLLRRSETK